MKQKYEKNSLEELTFVLIKDQPDFHYLDALFFDRVSFTTIQVVATPSTVIIRWFVNL